MLIYIIWLLALFLFHIHSTFVVNKCYMTTSIAVPTDKGPSLSGAIVMSVLMYGAETWSLTVVDPGKLDLFHMRCHRQLLNIHWSDHVTRSQ